MEKWKEAKQSKRRDWGFGQVRPGSWGCVQVLSTLQGRGMPKAGGLGKELWGQVEGTQNQEAAPGPGEGQRQGWVPRGVCPGRLKWPRRRSWSGPGAQVNLSSRPEGEAEWREGKGGQGPGRGREGQAW